MTYYEMSEMHDECFYEWEVVKTRFQIINDLECKSIRFLTRSAENKEKIAF